MTVAANEAEHSGPSNIGETEVVTWYPEVSIYFMPLGQLWEYCLPVDVCL